MYSSNMHTCLVPLRSVMMRHNLQGSIIYTHTHSSQPKPQKRGGKVWLIGYLSDAQLRDVDEHLDLVQAQNIGWLKNILIPLISISQAANAKRRRSPSPEDVREMGSHFMIISELIHWKLPLLSSLNTSSIRLCRIFGVLRYFNKMLWY